MLIAQKLLDYHYLAEEFYWCSVLQVAVPNILLLSRTVWWKRAAEATNCVLYYCSRLP